MGEIRTEICGNCEYWKELENIRGKGKCLRYPPQRLPGTTQWPETWKIDWCGEHVHKNDD